MRIKVKHRGFYNGHHDKKVCLLGENNVLEVLDSTPDERYICRYGKQLVQVEFENCDETNEEPTAYQELWTLR